MLNKEQILKVNDLKTEKVSVPEWGGEVCVRTMTGTDRDAFEQSIVTGPDKTNMENIRARLCALTIVDEKGERLFTDKDVAELGKKSALALDHIFTIAQRINGIGASDIEELAKNSETTPDEDSGSS